MATKTTACQPPKKAKKAGWDDMLKEDIHNVAQYAELDRQIAKVLCILRKEDRELAKGIQSNLLLMCDEVDLAARKSCSGLRAILSYIDNPHKDNRDISDAIVRAITFDHVSRCKIMDLNRKLRAAGKTVLTHIQSDPHYRYIRDEESQRTTWLLMTALFGAVAVIGVAVLFATSGIGMFIVGTTLSTGGTVGGALCYNEASALYREAKVDEAEAAMERVNQFAREVRSQCNNIFAEEPQSWHRRPELHQNLHNALQAAQRLVSIVSVTA